jgi:parallel beta-helix repeat protein
MDKKITVVIIILIVILVSVLFYVIIINLTPKGVRDINTGKIYPTIQEAIDARETLDGDTLLVYPGVYHENVFVNKTLTIEGQNKETTIVESPNSNSSGYYSQIMIIVNSANTTIANLTIQGNYFGIYCFQGNGCRILDNKVVNCIAAGIFINAASNVLVEDNEVSNETLRGIYLYNCLSTIVTGNKIDNIVGNETKNIFGLKGGLYIWLYGAIYLENSEDNTIVNNELTNSCSGIFLDANATDSKIYHNNFVNNTEPVQNIGGKNITWDNGSSSGGNYWSDYLTKYPNATEIDHTGIGNAPYVIDQEDKDIYPLMEPYPISAG